MKSLICAAAAALLVAAPAWAHGDGHAHPHPHTHEHTLGHDGNAKGSAVKLDGHTLEDIQRHRGMAQAHAQAAQCLEQGNNYETCQKQLQASCKGLALGKNCGMRHSH